MSRPLPSLPARVVRGFAALALCATALPGSVGTAFAQVPPPITPPLTTTLLPGETFTVTTNADSTDGACSTLCSLRDAIAAANAHLRVSGQLPDQIVFQIPGNQSLVIQPQTPLPPLTNSVIVDGANQPTPSFFIVNGQRVPFTIPHPGNVAVRGDSGISTGLSVNGSATLRNLEVANVAGTGIDVSGAGSTTLESLNVHNNGTGVNLRGTNGSLRTSTITQNGVGVGINGPFETVTGNTITGNTGNGVVIGGTRSTLGGGSAAERNVISGNGGHGVLITSAANTVSVFGNYIGTDASGASAQANAGNGITIAGDSGTLTIGGTSAASGNVISGNGGSGILANLMLSPTPGALVVQNNLIGTNATGTQAVPNGGSGVEVDGFTGTGADGLSPHLQLTTNVIAGNHQNGVLLFGGAHHVLQGNAIGTDAAATLNLGNGTNGQFHGVFIQDARLVTIGGATPSLGNVIAHNANSGVTVFTATADSLSAVGNTIRQNRIFANGRLGIDLAQTSAEAGFGIVTPNDSGDADHGANRRQNFPVLQSAVRQADGTLRVSGTLDSTPQAAYNLDFYVSSSCDVKGFGEAEQVVGSLQVSTAASNVVSFTFQSPGSTPLATGVVTATATRTGTGDTSEFSACVPLS